MAEMALQALGAGVELEIEAEAWRAAIADLDALTRRAVGAALAEVGASHAASVSLLFCDDARIAALNDSFRGKPKPTNVLSWPARALRRPLAPADFAAMGGVDSPDGFLGDVALALETICREAEAAGLGLEERLSHLIVHGVMHLCGYDHENDAEAAAMEAAETRALARLRIVDPYGAGGARGGWIEDDGR